jgi:hypothetical protein
MIVLHLQSVFVLFMISSMECNLTVNFFKKKKFACCLISIFHLNFGLTKSYNIIPMINKIRKIIFVSNYAQILNLVHIFTMLINFRQVKKKIHHHQSPNLEIFD